MKIGGEEIGIELFKVKRNLTNSLCTVYHGKNIHCSTHLGQFLERDSKSRHACNCVEDCNANATLALPLGIDGFDGTLEFIDKLVIINWPLDIQDLIFRRR